MSFGVFRKKIPREGCHGEPGFHYENVKSAAKGVYGNVKNEGSRSMPYVSLLTDSGRRPREKACKTGRSRSVPVFGGT